MSDRFDEMAEQILGIEEHRCDPARPATRCYACERRSRAADVIRAAVAAETERCAGIANAHARMMKLRADEFNTLASDIDDAIRSNGGEYSAKVIAAVILAEAVTPPRDATRPLSGNEFLELAARAFWPMTGDRLRAAVGYMADDTEQPPCDDAPAGAHAADEVVFWELNASERGSYFAEWGGMRLTVTMRVPQERSSITVDGAGWTSSRLFDGTLAAAKSAAESFARKIGAK